VCLSYILDARFLKVKQFQSLYLELGKTDGVGVSLVSIKCLETGGGHFDHCNVQHHLLFLILNTVIETF
jgi:hypothetical protein